MTVGELITKLQEYIDKGGRNSNRVYINDEYDVDNFTIDSVYYRCGEVVLQSNETDNGNWALIAPYVLHCLKFFKKKTNVCIQVSDEDLDWCYYDTDYCYIDGDDDFVIHCTERE